MECTRLSDTDVCKTEKLLRGSQDPSQEPLWHRDGIQCSESLCVGWGHEDLIGKDGSAESH